MPVFEQSYPSWSPSRGTRIRWLPVVRRELRQLWEQKPFKILLIVALFPAVVHLLQIYSVNKIAAEPNGDLARALNHVALSIDAEFFFRFLYVQTYFVFVLLLYASSGLICDDVRLNLAEVYFSKPLTTRDYLLGKVTTVVGLGLAYTVLPALFLFASHAMMVPESSFLRDHWWVPLSALGYGCLIVLPTVLVTLACSSLTSSRRYAAAALITLLAANALIAELLSDVLNRRAVNVISIPQSILSVGEALFGVERYLPLDWSWPLGVVTAVTTVGLVVLTRRIQRVEAGL
ncbi:MAG TPA: hypothetical protein DEA08_21570 [Planctomycetes bacterium]|nr:hypothetical protein [Planctomycetota bacterium]